MKPWPAHDFEWLPKPRSPRRPRTIAAVTCLVLAVLMLARSEEHGPRHGFSSRAAVAAPRLAIGIGIGIDDRMILAAPNGIDDRMILAAPVGIDDAMIVNAASNDIAAPIVVAPPTL